MSLTEVESRELQTCRVIHEVYMDVDVWLTQENVREGVKKWIHTRRGKGRGEVITARATNEKEKSKEEEEGGR